jgi:branched-chain amino acid transport system ATP-binding protein
MTLPLPPILSVSGLGVQYGQVVAVHGFDLELTAGSAVSILGTNGAGKTSCVESIVGLLPKSAGTVLYQSRNITAESASSIARAGIALVPQLRELFPNFTVEETLAAARRAAENRTALSRDEVYELFPRLSERARSLAGNLSGGEQQMLAIGRALVTRPHLLILDELSAGLAQGVVRSVIDSLKKIRASGLALIVVEQNLEIAAALTEHCIVMSAGAEAWRGPVQQAIHSEDIRNAFFQ